VTPLKKVSPLQVKKPFMQSTFTIINQKEFINFPAALHAGDTLLLENNPWQKKAKR
jgi:hypothetical protein